MPNKCTQVRLKLPFVTTSSCNITNFNGNTYKKELLLWNWNLVQNQVCKNFPAIFSKTQMTQRKKSQFTKKGHFYWVKTMVLCICLVRYVYCQLRHNTFLKTCYVHLWKILVAADLAAHAECVVHKGGRWMWYWRQLSVELAKVNGSWLTGQRGYVGLTVRRPSHRSTCSHCSV